MAPSWSWDNQCLLEIQPWSREVPQHLVRGLVSERATIFLQSPNNLPEKIKRFCFATPVAISIFLSNFFSLTAICLTLFSGNWRNNIFYTTVELSHSTGGLFLKCQAVTVANIYFCLVSVTVEFSIHWWKTWILQYLYLYLYWLSFFFSDVLHS